MQARRAPPKKSSSARRKKGGVEDVHLSVLFIESALGWSAQVLEHDIATQAKSLKQLFLEIERILVAQVAMAAEDGHRPFEGIPPAPERYWKLFQDSPRITMKRPAQALPPKVGAGSRIRKEIRVADQVAA